MAATLREEATARRWSSGCAASTCRWSTRCSPATASTRVAELAADGGGRARRDRRAAARGRGGRRRRRATDLAPLRALRRRPRQGPARGGARRGGGRGPDRGRRRASRGGAHARRRRRRGPRPEAAEFLHLAAVASLTEVAIEEAKEEVEQNLRGSFLEELRSRADLEPARGRAPRRPARLRPLARRGRAVRRAHHRPPAPRGGHDRRGVPRRAGPAHRRAASTRCCPRPGADDAPEATLARRPPARRAPAQRHGTVGLSSLLRRPAEFAPRDPGGRARARRPAPVRRADRRGHRHRHLPPALPRARLAPRGGALLLRGHRRADRPLRRPVRDRPRRARSRPTSTRTAT